MSVGNRPSFSREVKLQWAGSRERNLASGRGRTFFLTSLFIELIDPVNGVSRIEGLLHPTRCGPASHGTARRTCPIIKSPKL